VWTVSWGFSPSVWGWGWTKARCGGVRGVSGRGGRRGGMGRVRSGRVSSHRRWRGEMEGDGGCPCPSLVCVVVDADKCAFCREIPRRPRSPYCSGPCRRVAKVIRLRGGPCLACGRPAQRGRLYCGYHGRRRCIESGCRRLAVMWVSNEGLCLDHADGARRREHKLRREKRRGRGAESWDRVRRRMLLREPQCRRCGAPATEVDHVVPLWKGGGEDEGNLQALCRSCHGAKTAWEQRPPLRVRMSIASGQSRSGRASNGHDRRRGRGVGGEDAS